MKHHHDVVIIGGSLAGSACALELQQSGIDAVAFDRRPTGGSRVCGAFLSPGAVRALDRLEVLEDVLAQGAVHVEAAEIRVGAARLDLPFRDRALGFSRQKLDGMLAARASVHTEVSVERVEAGDSGFRVRIRDARTGSGTLSCRVVVDAAGRASRFSRPRSVHAYGVGFESPRSVGSVLDFEFFKGGYGGSVSVEGGRTNSCFLVDKARLETYRRHAGCRTTGPIHYDPLPSRYVAVGDAVGMMHPFCGEGMRHALESGRLAASTIAEGLAQGLSYPEIRMRYRGALDRDWRSKRRWANRLRWMFERSWVAGAGLRLSERFPSLAQTCLKELWR